MATGGIPVVSKLAAAFGVWAPNAMQQAALTDAVTWGGVLAGALILGDAGLRSARNSADAKRDAATAHASALIAASPNATVPLGGMAAHDPETGLSEQPLVHDPDVLDADDLPDDATELADPMAAAVLAELASDPDRPDA